MLQAEGKINHAICLEIGFKWSLFPLPDLGAISGVTLAPRLFAKPAFLEPADPTQLNEAQRHHAGRRVRNHVQRLTGA
jgi:hypothetical protein